MDLTVEGPVWYWRGPAPFHFLRLPEPQADAIADVAPAVSYGWGMVPVEARLGGTTWRTSLWPKDGSYLVPLKDAVRRAEGVEVDQLVRLTLHVDV